MTDTYQDPKAALQALGQLPGTEALGSVLAKQRGLEKEIDRNAAEGEKVFQQQRDRLTEFQAENPYPKAKLEPFTQERPKADPLKAFGSAGSILGILASALTRQPLASALNASAEAIGAARAGQLAEYEDAKQKWELNSQQALRSAEQDAKAYNAALDLMDKDMNAAIAQWKTHAAATENKGALLLAESGNIQAMQNFGISLQNAQLALAKSIPQMQEMADEQSYVLNYANDRAKDWQEQNPGQQPTPEQMNQWRVEGRNEYITREAQAKSGINGDMLIDDDTAYRLGEQLALAGDTSALVGWGRGKQGPQNIAKIQRFATEIAKGHGLNGEDIAARVAAFQGLKAEQRTAGTQQARIRIAAEEAYRMADLALDASKAFPRTQFVPVNTAYQEAAKGTGDTRISRFVAANTSFVNTYARAINPGGIPRVADKEHAMEMLNTAFTQEQYEAVIDQLKLEMQAALKAPAVVREGQKPAYEQSEGGQSPAAQPSAPSPYRTGAIVNGYYYGGGNWQDKSNWFPTRDGYMFMGDQNDPAQWQDQNYWQKIPAK